MVLVGAALLLTVFALVSLPSKAAAACAAQDTSRGTVTSTFTVATAGTYRVWSRILAPDATNNSYILEIDGSTCGIVVGDSAIPANTWTWVDYQGGTATSKVNVTLTAGTHTMTMIGREDNVQLDRVVLTTDTTCVPTGTGDNCANPADTTPPTTTLTAPTSGSIISGKTVTVSANASDDVAISKVEFYVDGVLKSTDTATAYSYVLDSTTLPNGNHTVYAIAYDTSNNHSQTTTSTVTVSNAPTCTAGSATAVTVPGSVTKTASTYTSISLSWSASTPSPGCTLSGYHVFRNGVQVGGNITSGTSYTDTGLTAGTSYSYSVEAYDTGPNTSAKSAAVSLASTSDNVAPNIPTSFAATSSSAAAVSLTWVAATDLPNPGGVGTSGYYIYRNGASTPTYTVSSAATTSFTDTNVTASTKYTYIISAFDKNANESAGSTSVSATTAAPTCSGTPSVPGGLAAGTSTLTSISFTWTASTASAGCTLSGYHVYRGGTYLGDTTSTSYTDTGLNANTSYNYTVSAFDTSAHVSAQSAAKVLATTADTSVPSAPANVNAAATSSSSVSLSWAASTDNVGVNSYKIYRTQGSTSTTFSVSSTTLSFVDTTVASNSTYAYQISALDVAGNESTKAPSTPVSVTTPVSADTTAPSAPSAPTAPVITTDAASLTWSPSTDNVGVIGYHVYINGVYDSFDKDATSANFTLQCLAPSTVYTVTIKAFDSAGNTSNAASVQVTTLSGGLSGDYDCNARVDSADLSALARNWNGTGKLPTDGDSNGDTKITSADLSALARNWRKTLP